MSVDLYRLGFALFPSICSIAGAILSLKQYKKVGTYFYRYSTLFFIFVSFWFSSSIIQAIFEHEEFYWFVLPITRFLLPWGYLGLAFLIAAFENVRKSSRTFLQNIGFIVSGIIMILFLHPAVLQLYWDENRWAITYSWIFQILRLVIYIILILSALPIIIHTISKIRNSSHPDNSVLVFLVVGCITAPIALLLQGFHEGELFDIMPSIDPALYFTGLGIFLLLFVIMFKRHPMIFFSGIQDLTELYIISTKSGLPVYYHNFKQKENEYSPEVISALFTGIRHYIQHNLESGDIESITANENEILVYGGEEVYGILVAQQTSALLTSLLRLTVQEFEKKFEEKPLDYTMGDQFKEFDSKIKRFFEFASPRD